MKKLYIHTLEYANRIRGGIAPDPKWLEKDPHLELQIRIECSPAIAFKRNGKM